jgi:hypothetical protein
MPRFEPYTATGIKRVPCARCGQSGHASWNICADKVRGRDQFRALCVECDIRMNEVAMRFVFGDSRNADLIAYGQAARDNQPPRSHALYGALSDTEERG